jgi:hypothetical protein
MNTVDPPSGLCWGGHYSFSVRVQYLESFHYLKTKAFPLFNGWFSSEGGAVVEDKFIGIVWFDQTGQWLIYFLYEFVGVIVKESILKY